MLPVSLEESACDIIEAARPMLVDAILAGSLDPMDSQVLDIYELRYLLSCLEDGAAMAKPELLRQHLEWNSAIGKPNGRAPADLIEALRALGDELGQSLPPELAAVFTMPLQAALGE